MATAGTFLARVGGGSLARVGGGSLARLAGGSLALAGDSGSALSASRLLTDGTSRGGDALSALAGTNPHFEKPHTHYTDTLHRHITQTHYTDTRGCPHLLELWLSD